MNKLYCSQIYKSLFYLPDLRLLNSYNALLSNVSEGISYLHGYRHSLIGSHLR